VWVTAYAGEEDRIGAQIVDIPQNDLFRSTFTNSSRSCFCFLMSAGSKLTVVASEKWLSDREQDDDSGFSEANFRKPGKDYLLLCSSKIIWKKTK